MKTLFLLAIWLMYSITMYAQSHIINNKLSHADSSTRPHPFQYGKDAGVQYKNGDFTLTTWAYAERLSAGNTAPAWRRVRQGMEFKFPAYHFRINGNRFRTAFMYEVDFTDNNFFKATRKFKDWENLFVAFQNADDPNKFRVVFGENTNILSREDNLSSGNLPNINRSLILEQHGSVNNFGVQWGLQVQKQLNDKTFLQVSLQDNRGSMNTDSAHYKFWKGITVKLTKTFIQSSNNNPQRLNIGAAIDHTRDIKYRSFALSSAINQIAIGSTPASGNKLTFENNADYTNKINSHLYSVEYEIMHSRYSDQLLNVAGGYALLQYQLFDTKMYGDLVPFVRYDLVNLSNPTASASEQAVRAGVNYNLPFTHKLVNLHLEYANHLINGSGKILSVQKNNFDELRLELRVSATRYLRF